MHHPLGRNLVVVKPGGDSAASRSPHPRPALPDPRGPTRRACASPPGLPRTARPELQEVGDGPALPGEALVVEALALLLRPVAGPVHHVLGEPGEPSVRAKLVTADSEIELGGLAVHALTARIDEVDGQQGVVLDDGDGMVELSEAFGHRSDMVRAYKRTAGVLLARASMLEAEGPPKT